MAGRFAPAPLLALSLWSLAGCYMYVPVTTPSSTLTGEGRITLTDAGTTTLAAQLGAGVHEIDGTILRVTADSVVMTVAETTTATRERFVQSGTTVAIPRPLIRQVAARTLSRKRTLTLTAVVGTVLSVVLRASGSFGGGGTGDAGGGIQP